MLYNRLLESYNIFPSTQQYDICIYFNITYIVILATCFDSYESSSGINISPGFEMHKVIRIAIVRLRHKKL